MENNFYFAILLTLFAGLSTGIGGSVVLFSKKINEKLLSSSLGFSAGVMLYVSFMELMPQSIENINVLYSDKMSYIYSVAAFFAGILFIGIIDRFVPEADNPHEFSQISKSSGNLGHFKRVGLLSALAIGIHNFPEGLATFVSAYNDVSLGISVTIAIAIHNIPEGISVAVPISFATNNKRKAFLISLSSGLAEPIGALLGHLILLPFLNTFIMGILFAIVSGIMVYISLDELLPSAEKFGHHHLSIYGLIAGMATMAFSLILLK